MIVRLAIVAVCAVVAIGCGSDGAEPEAPPAEAAEATPERSADEQAAAEMAMRYLNAVTEPARPAR